ncbi:MAG TPA: hypothetical protein VF234_04810 [Limnochordia bacterium]
MGMRRRWIFRGLAIAAALLASAQPILGSFALFRRADPVDYAALHLAVGGILYNITIVLAVLLLFTKVTRLWLLFSICVLQYALTHIQLRLGLASNVDAVLLAYHIPLGVLIFFLAYLTMALSFGLRLHESNP